MSERSPLPWSLKEEKILNCIRVLDAEGYTVTLLDRGYLQDEDKEFIVLAVNRHDELEYCLRRIIEDLPTKRDWLDPEIERIARAVLAKVKEGK